RVRARAFARRSTSRFRWHSSPSRPSYRRKARSAPRGGTMVNVRDVGTLHAELLETYIRYVDTPFRLRHAGLAEERRQLLRTPGTIQQPPIFEFLPGHEQSTGSLRDAIVAAGFGRSAADFLQAGLWTHGERPYTHQDH